MENLLKRYQFKSKFSTKTILLVYLSCVLIFLLVPFLYTSLGWARLNLYGDVLYAKYNKYLVISSILIFFHLFIPAAFIPFFILFFGRKNDNEIFFDDEKFGFLRGSDLKRSDLKSFIVYYSDIDTIDIGNNRVDIFYNKNEKIIVETNSFLTRYTDFDKVIDEFRKIKHSLIKNREDFTSNRFEGKAIIFKNYFEYLLGLLIISVTFFLVVYFGAMLFLNSPFDFFLKEVLGLGRIFRNIVTIPFFIIYLILIYVMFKKIFWKKIIFNFNNNEEMELLICNKRKVIKLNQVLKIKLVIPKGNPSVIHLHINDSFLNKTLFFFLRLNNISNVYSVLDSYFLKNKKKKEHKGNESLVIRYKK